MELEAQVMKTSPLRPAVYLQTQDDWAFWINSDSNQGGKISLLQCSWYNITQHPMPKCRQLYKTCLTGQAQLTMEGRIKVWSCKLFLRNKQNQVILEIHTGTSRAVSEYIPSEYSFMLLVKPVCYPQRMFFASPNTSQYTAKRPNARDNPSIHNHWSSSFLLALHPSQMQ